MNVRDAILKAADHIESDPNRWDFYDRRVPCGCGTPGCALGWIAFFLGVTSLQAVATRLVGENHYFPESEVYNRIEVLMTGSRGLGKDNYWLATCTPQEAAHAMRLYADEYHPAPKVEHVGLPDSVREIFEKSAVVC